MRLIMDVGNTNVTLGVWDGKSFVGKWRMPTDTIDTEDQFFSAIYPLLLAAKIEVESIDTIAIACVVPGTIGIFNAFAKKYFKTTPVFVSPMEGLDVTWKADNNAEIGPDRIANVLGAKDHFGSNAIILDFGSAINVDILHEDAFVGGAILLGITTAMKALFDLFFEDHYQGTNTGDNIRIGLVNGTYHALEGITANIRKELNTDMPIIATGGLSNLFQFEGTFIDHFDDDLTLKGVISFQNRV
jgi:type III pantothenate kinase